MTEQKLLVNQRHHVQTSRIHFHHFWVYIIGYCAIHSSTPIKHSRPSKQPPTTNMQHVTVCYCLTLRTNKLHSNDIDPVTHAECSLCVIALWGVGCWVKWSDLLGFHKGINIMFRDGCVIQQAVWSIANVFLFHSTFARALCAMFAIARYTASFAFHTTIGIYVVGKFGCDMLVGLIFMLYLNRKLIWI